MSTITLSPLEAAVLGELAASHRYMWEFKRVLCPEHQVEEIGYALAVLEEHGLVKRLYFCRPEPFWLATARGVVASREYGRQMIDQWRWSGEVRRAA